MNKRILLVVFFLSLLLTGGLAPVQGQSSRLEAFGVFSPVLGIQEAIPSVTIPEVFTSDNENVALRYGEIHRARMRRDSAIDTTVGAAVFTDGGSAQDDCTSGGNYTGIYSIDYRVQIDAEATPDTFKWSKDEGSTWEAETVAITGAAQTLDLGVTVTFAGTTGHDVGDRWDFTVSSAQAAMPDDNPVLRYHWLERSNGNDYLFAFTTAHAYWWNTGTSEWDLKHTCASNCTTWSTVSFNDTLYATNNIDKVLETNDSGAFAVLDEGGGLDIDDADTFLTKARFITAFEGYLIVGNVAVGGSNYPTAIYWSDTQDPTDWGSGNAGSLILPGPDFLVGTGQIADFLLIFAGRTIDQLWATESTLIFNARRLRTNMGTNAPDSIVNGPAGELFFMDNRKNLRVIRSVMSDMEVISRSIEPSVRQIPDSLVSGVRSCWVDSLEQIWWALPYGPQATANNRIFCRDAYGAWTKRNIPASAFGEYEIKSTWTWTTLPYSTWPTWDWEQWWTVEVLAEAHLDLCGDYSGYTYESHYTDTDSGDAFTGYAVIETDFSQAKGTPLVDRYKRLVFFTTIFRNEGAGTATISLKRDFEYAWQTVGTVDLNGTTDYIWTKTNADYRARHYSVKISGANRFRFVGCIFYYVSEGLR